MSATGKYIQALGINTVDQNREFLKYDNSYLSQQISFVDYFTYPGVEKISTLFFRHGILIKF